MGNNEAGTNYGPIGKVVQDEETGVFSAEVSQSAELLMAGQPIYTVEPELYAIAAGITEAFKAYDAERFEPVKTTYKSPISGLEVENAVTVSVRLLRELEAFMDAAERTSPLADRAQELYLSGRADERWIKVAQPWQIGAAFANPTVACILHLTKDGYAAALADVGNAAW